MLSPHVVIIVLNWNGINFVIDCLKSLKKIHSQSVEILVVDNNSTDGSRESIKKNFPEFNILVLDKNYGYARGNNKGFESLKKNPPEFVCFLNNDTIVEKDFLVHILNAVKKYGNKYIYGPKILFLDKPEKIWYNGGIVDLEKGIIKHNNIGFIDSEKKSEIKKTDYITGCCLFLHWEKLCLLNGFDEGFKMYGEDVDLCLRASKIDIGCRVVPNSVIYHAVSSSLGGRYSIRKQLKKMKAIYLLINTHAPHKSKLIILLKTIFNDLKNIFLVKKISKYKF